jgi:hypothetical protein
MTACIDDERGIDSVGGGRFDGTGVEAGEDRRHASIPLSGQPVGVEV